MNHKERALASLAVALAFLLAACGGRDSVASRSAAAYDEAKRTGTPAGGGHEHGGHAVTGTADHDEVADMPGMDHSQMQGGTMTGMDHSKMQSGAMSGMDHSRMQSGSMAGMDHSKMQSGAMSGMDHSQMQSGSMAGMDHSKAQSGGMAGMDHSKARSGSMAEMDHSQMRHGAAPTPPLPPSSTGEASRIRPEGTLMQDPFDAPAAVSVTEALKAANNVPDGDIRHVVPGEDHENPPTPRPAVPGGSGGQPGHEQHGVTTPMPSAPATDHGAHGSAAAPAPGPAPAEATVYTCPMHPEVTSEGPGSCPKCGMALVKKK